MIIQVPATSANLGPGFDSFGIAWKLYNRIEFDVNCDTLQISGCDARYADENNLAYRAYRHTLERCGIIPGGLSIRFVSTDIPVSRGLGSSAALCCAGILAANELHSLRLQKQDMLSLATELEGHPDNAAPALFGGFTVSAVCGGKAVTECCPVSQDLHFTVLIPDFELSTARARAALPGTVSMADAVFNLSHASFMLRALEKGDMELLTLAMDDKLHQPYRRALIPGYDKAEALAKELGAAGICISGAGSTLLCVSDSPSVGTKLKEALSEKLPGWRVENVEIDRMGATVI